MIDKSHPSRILAIETSCDETAAAVIENGRALLSSVVASQMEMHARYGGVFPEVASRQHVLSILPVVQEALDKANLSLADLDAIAVTRGPGLAGSLVVGMNAAKGLALGSGKPLVGANHLEGHIYASWLYEAGTETPPEAPRFPLLALLVSGGHTELDLMTGHLQYQRLGATLDDAAGEAFDKVARLLGSALSRRPLNSKSRRERRPTAFKFTRPKTDGVWDFSFSGIKTAVLYTVRDLEKTSQPIPVADIAASFQATVVDYLIAKTVDAARAHNVSELLLAGGVSANKPLREAFLNLQNDGFKVHIPPFAYCTDNAAMIAAAGAFRFMNGHVSGLDMDVLPTWPLS
jgi:N6-L-threonylcarbamoyladenine synthase